MRILIATTNRHVVGGIEKYLQTVIPGLVERGHSIGLLFERPAETGLEPIDAATLNLPACNWSETGLLGAMRWAAEWRPDVVFNNGLDDCLLEETLADAFPGVLYFHSYRGTCISGRKCHAFPAIRACSRPFDPACLLFYYPRRCGGLNPFTMWHAYQRQSRRKTCFSKYRAILTNSSHMQHELEISGVSSSAISVLRLPVEGKPDVAVKEGRSSPPSEILFLGRLEDVKGVDYLIRAVQMAETGLNRRLTLTVAGDGLDRQKLQALSEECGVRTDFVGWVNSSRREELMRKAHLLAVPSLWPEPFGMVGIEGFLLGLPAVGYRVGGVPDWLIPGVSGELADANPPTVAGLAAAIIRAISDESYYADLCSGARQVATRYSLEAHIDQLESVLRAQIEQVGV